jgi:hypothetical protein
MKRYLFILGIIGMITFSCHKVKKLKDDISSRKYIPQLVLSPADSVATIYSPTCSESIPFPTDSTQFVLIDVDKDGFNDFKFTYSASYNFVSSIDSCENHNSQIVVEAIGSENRVIVDEDNAENVRVFAVDDEIKISSSIAVNATIFLDDASISEDVILETGNKYLGVKLASNTVGWIKVYHDRGTFRFAILEHAFNRTFQLNIKAGQTQ